MSFSPHMKDVADVVAETLWLSGVALAGRCFRSSFTRWSSPGRQRVLVIAPHPDDEAIGCVGTLIRHRQCGDLVSLVHVTDGRRSRALGLGPEEMARRRKREAEAVAQRLSVNCWEWLGLPEGDWTAEQLRSRLQPLIAQFAPQIMYVPSRIDFHPEHRRVAYVLAALLAGQADVSPVSQIRTYQLQVPLTPVFTNLVTDTSSVARDSETILDCYETQRTNMPRALRQRRYAARFYGTATYAEEFWQGTPQQYCTLHNTPPDDWSADGFRGLRFRALGDPLAYLWGLRTRRQLASLVCRPASQV